MTSSCVRSQITHRDPGGWFFFFFLRLKRSCNKVNGVRKDLLSHCWQTCSLDLLAVIDLWRGEASLQEKYWGLTYGGGSKITFKLTFKCAASIKALLHWKLLNLWYFLPCKEHFLSSYYFGLEQRSLWHIFEVQTLPFFYLSLFLFSFCLTWVCFMQSTFVMLQTSPKCHSSYFNLILRTTIILECYNAAWRGLLCVWFYSFRIFYQGGFGLYGQ